MRLLLLSGVCEGALRGLWPLLAERVRSLERLPLLAGLGECHLGQGLGLLPCRLLRQLL